MMSAARRKPRAYSASMTEKVKLTGYGSVPRPARGRVAAGDLPQFVDRRHRLDQPGLRGLVAGEHVLRGGRRRVQGMRAEGEAAGVLACGQLDRVVRGQVEGRGVAGRGSAAAVATVETVKNCCTARTNARTRVAT